MDRKSTVNQQAMKGKNQQKSGSLEEYIKKMQLLYHHSNYLFLVKI
jgi:hypothetical protein